MKRTREGETYRSKEYKLRLCAIDVGTMYAVGVPTSMSHYRSLFEDTVYYRVAIGGVFTEVTSLEMEDVDDPLNGLYDELSDLPDWMQERIAMLSMLSFKPPTETVHGVGRRISEFTYWVERPDSCA